MDAAIEIWTTKTIKILCQDIIYLVDKMKIKAFYTATVILVLFFGLLNAIVISGDAGESFAKNKSAEMCASPLVKEVYICSGNVVKVVWADAGRGATFYVPDGRIIDCPVVEAGKASAECVQFSVPNYCTQKVECGKKTQTPPAEPAQEQKNESAPAVEQQAEEKTDGEKKTLDTGPIIIGYTGGQAQKTDEKGGFDAPLLLVVAIAMLAVLAAVYFVFKKTTRA